jgi:hypothetical protein
MSIDEQVAEACSLVPELLRSALVLLPEGLILGATGDDALSHEVLARSARRCGETRGRPTRTTRPPGHFVEYAFVYAEELVVVQMGRREGRLAFVAVCRRTTNLALVLTSTRQVIDALERGVDGAAWQP